MNIQHQGQMDRGLAYAEACFETFRVIDGFIFAWHEHWQRLCLGLDSFGIQLDPDLEQDIQQACLTYAQQESNDCLVRLTISGGSTDWGLIKSATPNIQVQTLPYTNPNNTPLHAIAVEYPFAVQEKTAKFTSDYAYTLKAIQLWQKKHAATDPQQFIVCKQEQVLSGITSNIVMYDEGKWLTPQGSGILSGIVRQFLMQQDVIQTQICPTALLATCEAMLLLNSGQFLRPVQSINGRELDTQHPAIFALKQTLNSEDGVKLDPQ